MSVGGDVHSKQKLPAHMVRREMSTQAVAHWLIAVYTQWQEKYGIEKSNVIFINVLKLIEFTELYFFLFLLTHSLHIEREDGKSKRTLGFENLNQVYCN